MSASHSGKVYLGFDFGVKRIGVAVGECLTQRARPLPVLAHGRAVPCDKVDLLLREWQPQACIVGLPLDLDGKDQPITAQARAFAAQLHQRCGIPVHLCDERLSSRAADDELREARADGRMTRRVRQGDRDGVAARLILEQWMAGTEGTK